MSFTPFDAGDRYHEATGHSWISVRRHAHGLDWASQPSVYKRYPSFFPRLSLSKSEPVRAFLHRIGGITAKKSYPGVEYYLRSNPSAGALYPNELYFQCRGVEELADGIYHYEVSSASAVLLAEIGPEEGLEAFLPRKRRHRGILLFVSGVYWRSAWKYRDRAFRYVLLDGGHLLGSAEASALLTDREYRIIYRIDRSGLNRLFGFGSEEGMLSAFAWGEEESTSVATPYSLPESPDPTGSFGRSELIERAYRETMALQGCRDERHRPVLSFDRDAWAEAIKRRRSLRAFRGASISREEFERIEQWATQPLPSDCDEPLNLYWVINRVEGLPRGIRREGVTVREGDFAEQAGYLCLEQALGRDSAATLFISSGGRNYQALYQKAGAVGQRLYLAAQVQGIGASGIGAYYDEEVREFLETEEKILYAFAIGR